VKRKSFTLLELLVVLIIVGILATIGLVNQSGVREEALDKEARANLKLIVAAEKIYAMETGNATYGSNITDLNTHLKLLLPAGARRNWDYNVSYDPCCGHPEGPPCCAEATRVLLSGPAPARKWKLSCRTFCGGEEPKLGICGICP